MDDYVNQGDPPNSGQGSGSGGNQKGTNSSGDTGRMEITVILQLLGQTASFYTVSVSIDFEMLFHPIKTSHFMKYSFLL